MLSKRRTLRYAQSIQNIDLAYIDCIDHLITAIRRAANFKSLLVVAGFFDNNLTLEAPILQNGQTHSNDTKCI